jgi:hypothetical protein
MCELHHICRRFNYPIEPMDLANMRQNGVRSLDVTCRQCHRETKSDRGHSAGSALTSFRDRRDCLTGADMTAPENIPSWLVERSILAAKGNILPPRDPNDDEDEDEDAEPDDDLEPAVIREPDE